MYKHLSQNTTTHTSASNIRLPAYTPRWNKIYLVHESQIRSDLVSSNSISYTSSALARGIPTVCSHITSGANEFWVKLVWLTLLLVSLNTLIHMHALCQIRTCNALLYFQRALVFLPFIGVQGNYYVSFMANQSQLINLVGQDFCLCEPMLFPTVKDQFWCHLLYLAVVPLYHS